MHYRYILVVLLCIIGLQLNAQTSADVNWDSRFCPCGVTFEPTAIVKDSNKLYIGGKLSSYDVNQAQGRDIRLPAVWDGKEWSSLGGGVNFHAQHIFNFGDTVLVAGFLDTNIGHIYERAKFWDKRTEQWFSAPDVDAYPYGPAVADDKDLFMTGRLLGDTSYGYKIIRYNYKDGKWYTLPTKINEDFVISPRNVSNGYILSLNDNGLFVATGFQKESDTTKYLTVLKFDRDSNTWSFLSDSFVEVYRDTSIDTIPAIPYEINSIVAGKNDTLFVTFVVNSYWTDYLPIGGFWDGKKWQIWSNIRALPLAKDDRFYERDFLQFDGNKLYMTGYAFIVDNKDTINKCVQWDNGQWRDPFPGLQPSYHYTTNTRILDGIAYSFNEGINVPKGAQEYLGRWNGKNWVPIDSGSCFGLNGKVYSSTIYNDTLYVNGDFTRAGGVATPGMAFWDGNNWTSMGDIYALNDYPIRPICLKVYKNKLYGGTNSYDSDSSSGLVVWQNSEWRNIFKDNSVGLISNVLALEVSNDTLIVAGEQPYHNNSASDMIVKWDGEKWNKFSTISSTDTSTTSSHLIRNITSDGKNIYVAGEFVLLGNDTMYSIAKWTGIEWVPLKTDDLIGLGPNNSATSIKYDTTNKRLIIAAYFDDIIGEKCYGLAKWDGNNFSSVIKTKFPVGNANSASPGIALYANYLYLSWVNTYPSPYLPVRVDTNGLRYALGSGLTYPLGTYGPSGLMETDSKGNLYLLGNFYKAGKKPSANIALWRNTPTSSIHIKNVSKNNSTAFPNPASGFVRFNVESTIESIIITDVLGKEIEKIYSDDKSSLLLDLANYNPGVYNALIQTTSSKQNVRFVVMK